MMAKNIPKMPLPKLDDLFTTEEERTNDKLEKVIDIKISDIDDFPDHPFKVIENEDMYNMRDSIKENGVLVVFEICFTTRSTLIGVFKASIGIIFEISLT